MIRKLVILATLVFGMYLSLRAEVFELAADSKIYADIARNIVEGRGLTSSTIMASLLSYTPLTPAGNWPPFYSPLYPLVIAFGFYVFDIRALTVVGIAGFFFIITVPFVYLLAKKIYNEKVALLASLWYIFSPRLLDYSATGMSETFFTFLIVSSALLLFSRANAFWPGVFVGLSTLTRFQGYLLFIPFWIYSIVSSRQKKRQFILFLLGFLLVMMLRKLILPPIAFDFTSFSNSQLWSYIADQAITTRDYLFRSLDPVTFGKILEHRDLVLGKIITNAYFWAQKLFTDLPAPVVILYILGLSRSDTRKIYSFNLLVLVTFLTFSLFHIATFMDFRYIHPLLPLLIIFASGTLIHYLQMLKSRQKNLLFTLAILIFTIIPFLTSPGFATSVQRSIAQPRKPPFNELLGEFVANNTTEEQVIVSDAAASIAWHGHRKAIFNPIMLEEISRIDQKFVPIDGIFLFSHPFKPQYDPEWQTLLDHPQDFDNFYPAKELTITADENYYRIPVKGILYLKKNNQPQNEAIQ